MRPTGDVFVAPLDDKHVLARLTRAVCDRVLVVADVADCHFITRNSRTDHSHQQHVVTCAQPCIPSNMTLIHTHTHPFNGPLSRTTRVQYNKIVQEQSVYSNLVVIYTNYIVLVIYYYCCCCCCILLYYYTQKYNNNMTHTHSLTALCPGLPG